MSAITPQTELRLLTTVLEKDNKHQLNFASEQHQYGYFNSLPHTSCDNFTYQRKDSTIRYPAHIDNLLNYNYVMYQNEAYGNKWFYAFITNMEYINDNMTAITIKTDVWQTWQFNLTFKTSFVEREHVSDDTRGLHTVDEELETGPYVCNNASNITIGTGDLICCLCTDFPTVLQQYFKQSKYNGIYSGAKAVAFATVQDASYFVQYMENQAKGDAVISFFMLPNAIISGDLTFFTRQLDMDSSIFGVDKVNVTFAPISTTDGETYMGVASVTNLSSLNGYTPKNNKLFIGKYNYFYVTNNAGSDVVFHYEDFVSNSPSFELSGAFTPGGSMKLIPKNYLKTSDGSGTKYFFNYGITGPKYPICSWSSDSYAVWLSENSLNIALENTKNAGSIALGVVGLVAGLATGNTALAGASGTALLSGSSGVINTMKEKYVHSQTPDQAKGNTNSGDVQYSCGKNCFTIFKMSVKNEYAKQIDDYFELYGYKVNTLKTPVINSRRYWNYIKTVGANIEGNIPQGDLEEIKTLFNTGITFWHDTSNFLNYSLTNSIV